MDHVAFIHCFILYCAILLKLNDDDDDDDDYQSAFGPLCEKHDVIRSQKRKYLLQCLQNKPEPRPHVMCVENFVKFRRVVIEASAVRTDRQTDRHPDRNTSHHCRRRSNNEPIVKRLKKR